MNATTLDTASVATRLSTLIRAGDHIWWGQATAEPLTLTRALVEHRHAIAQGGRLSVFVGIGQSETLQPAQADVIDFFGYAASGPHRQLARAGVLDIVPSHYSHLPGLIRARTLRADVLLVQVSPPDEEGRYSLGLVHEYIPAALDRARVIIAEVNPGVPWTHGSRHLTADDIDLLVDAARARSAWNAARPAPRSRLLPATSPAGSRTEPPCRWVSATCPKPSWRR